MSMLYSEDAGLCAKKMRLIIITLCRHHLEVRVKGAEDCGKIGVAEIKWLVDVEADCIREMFDAREITRMKAVEKRGSQRLTEIDGLGTVEADYIQKDVWSQGGSKGEGR